MSYLEPRGYRAILHPFAIASYFYVAVWLEKNNFGSGRAFHFQFSAESMGCL